MPWVTISTAILSAATKAAAGSLLRGGARVFQERRSAGRLPFMRKAYTDRYPALTTEQLLAAYKAESPLTVDLGSSVYTLPVSLEVGARGEDGAPSRVSFEISREKFAVPAKLNPYTEPILQDLRTARHDHMFDGAVASLRGLERSAAGDWTGVLKQASYFEAVATNFTMDHRPPSCPESLRARLSGRTHRLGDFDGSPLVNHLGVVCILESEDGMLVVQRRGTAVANRGGTLSSSASGAVEFNELARMGQSGIQLEDVVESAIRETYYELGIRPSSLEFLGLIREFARGGKPELYVFCRSEEPFSRIVLSRRTAQERKETTELVSYPLLTEDLGEGGRRETAFLARAQDILEKVGPRANLTLVTGISLLVGARVGFS